MDGKWKSLAATALLTGVKLGERPPFTFKTQGSLGATFEMPVAPGKLSFTVTGRHMDHYFQQVAHLFDALDRVDARNWVDAGATFESKDGAHKLALNVKNVTDEQGQYSALNSTFLFNTIVPTRQARRGTAAARSSKPEPASHRIAAPSS
ncbi:MAG: hypothetical protein U1F11_01545 [Steroidobacteraceae bacterium]